MHSPEPQLRTEGLCVSLSDGERRFRLVADGFALLPGQVACLTGESGTGKTLFLELLGLLRRPDPGGRYHVHDGNTLRDLAGDWATGRDALTRLRGAMFGFVPQSGGLLPFLSVRDNIALGQRVTGRLDPSRVDHLMAVLGISGLAKLLPARLSIGQRQRVAIARALAHRPAVVIADEPTAALDPETSRHAMALLVDTAREDRTAVVVSSHDLALVGQFEMERYRLQLEVGDSPDELTSRLFKAEADHEADP